jgi:hypothetical protein
VSAHHLKTSCSLEVIIFCSVWFLLKKIIKLNFFKKKPKSGQTDWFRFYLVFLGPKPVQTGLAWFFPVWLGFLPVWVWFGFFSFRLIKPKPNLLVFPKF